MTHHKLSLLVSAVAEHLADAVAYLSIIRISAKRCLILSLLFCSSLTAALTVYPAPQQCYTNNQISAARFGTRLKQGTGSWQTLPLYDFFDTYTYNSAPTAEPHFGYFDSTGDVTVEVTVQFAVNSYVVRPRNAHVVSTRSGNVITITMRDDTRQIALEVNGQKTKPLLLFSNPLDPGPPTTGNREIYLGDRTEAGVARSGYHEKTNQWFTRHGDTAAYLGATMYIAGGAVVAGQPLIHTNRDYTIRGRGILFSPLKDSAGTNVGVPLTIQNCGTTSTGSGVVNVDGIIIVSRAENWTTHIRSSDQVNFTNVKILSEIRDGFDILNSQSVTADRCFFMSHDDTNCLKGMGFGLDESVTSFTLKNSILANMGGGNPVRIGWEADAPSISGAYYDNIDVIYSIAVGPSDPNSIWQEAVFQINGYTAQDASCAIIENINFNNIRIEDSDENFFVYIAGMSGDGSSAIRNINFNNCRFNSGNTKPSILKGVADCPVSNVDFTDCYHILKRLRSNADASLTHSGSASGTTFNEGITIYEAETNWATVTEAGSRPMGLNDSQSASANRCISLPDAGDKASSTFNVTTAGTYDVDVRVRFGWTGSPRALANSYTVTLDGAAVNATPVLESAVEVFTGNYDAFGYLSIPARSLTAGSHSVTVRSTATYSKVDTVELFR
jgi:hypothetical protein